MDLNALDYNYPERLIATEKNSQSRVLLSTANEYAQEITIPGLLEHFQAGDVFLINDSRVLPRRIFAEKDLEILFVDQIENDKWIVLFPASRLKEDGKIRLPGGLQAELAQGGLPQVLSVSASIGEDYFNEYGELPLPPYIQKARKLRHNKTDDKTSYQTAWAKRPGSLAAPTASFHFAIDHLKQLREKGVKIMPITLHVGLGTFLPIKTENLEDHKMHSEYVEVPHTTWEAINEAKMSGKRIWALGSTVTRAVESCALNRLGNAAQSYKGWSDLFIRPRFDFRIADVLLTNFHQPKTTLMAMVAAFAGTERVKKAYTWAVEREFKLFSYGDLSVWM